MIRELHIGPAGWSYPDWKGVVYPERTSAGFDPLVYLASYFNLIEINNTFYRVPPRDTVASWARRIANIDDFCFTAKLYREFTHSTLAPAGDDVAVFKDALAPLYEAGRLGAVLVQFPWSFRFDGDGRKRVVELTDWLRPYASFVEVRHGGWGSPKAAAFFADHGIGMCGIDQPLIGDSLRFDRCEPGEAGLYFRLHGRNHANWFNEKADRDARYDYLYTDGEIERIADRISEAARETGGVFVVTNNHFRGQAAANALELDAALTGRKPLAPRGLLRVFPRLAHIVEPHTAPVPGRATDERQISLFEDEPDD